METPDHSTTPPPLARLMEAACELNTLNDELRSENAQLKGEVNTLRHELDEARKRTAYLQGRLDEAEKAHAGQHVENNFYNDRTTQIRDSGLDGTHFHMQVLKNPEQN